MSLGHIVDRLDWPRIEAELGQEGHAVLPGVLDEERVRELALLHRADETVLADLRRHFYPRLAPIANRWNAALDVAHTFPGSLDALATQGRSAWGHPAHSSFTRLREGEHEALLQYGGPPHAFPLQLVVLLSEPGKDFTGGEFVMTEQRPRMQSRPMVLPLRRGDLAVITVAQRPHRGSKGSYRVNMKHAISRVRSGERIGVELLFDDALST